MGRTLKRVPLDFNWPSGKLWKGYINPYRAIECPYCDRSGYNPETKRISESFYNGERWCDKITQDEVEALIQHDRLREFTHTYIPGIGWKPIDPPPVVTAEQINAWQRGRGIGHDGVNRHILIEARATRLGVWGLCPECDGSGSIFSTPEIKKLHEEWKDYEPPNGEGYQLWETTSEGSPVSPVFKTLDELCSWCEGNASTFGSHKATKDEWKQMLDADFVAHKAGNMVFM